MNLETAVGTVCNHSLTVVARKTPRLGFPPRTAIPEVTAGLAGGETRLESCPRWVMLQLPHHSGFTWGHPQSMCHGDSRPRFRLGFRAATGRPPSPYRAATILPSAQAIMPGINDLVRSG